MKYSPMDSSGREIVMRPSQVFGALLLLASFGVSPVRAADPPSLPTLEMEDEVVVEGWRPLPEQIDNFVLEALPTKGARQLARWYRSICPVILGLPAEQAALMKLRLQVAAAEVAQLPSAKQGCKPNIAIFATDSPDALIEGLIKRYPKIYNPELSVKFRNVLGKPRDAHGAIRVWYRTRTTSADGLGPRIDGDGRRAIPTFSSPIPSRIIVPTREELQRVLIIIDPRQFQGQTVEAVADHLAMLVLGQFEGDVGAGIPTILNLFSDNPSTMPTVMTEWDKTMLRGLYAAKEDYTIWKQRRYVARHMKEAIEQP